MPKARKKREGRENMGPPTVLESLTSASPVLKKVSKISRFFSIPSLSITEADLAPLHRFCL